MIVREISEDEFDDLLRSFGRTAFHFEAQSTYRLTYEQADFDLFLAGTPRDPADIDWWRPWLERVATFAEQGKRISRVRLLAEPPSDYQRWELWADPFHDAAGEDIRYMPRSHAGALGLPLDNDWWLLDDERVIVTQFTATGEIACKYLSTRPLTVASYRAWRDLAVRNATPAEEIAAA
jgi:hypothetical protein